LRGAHERLARAAALIQECHPRLGVRLASQRLDAIQNRLTRATGQSLLSRLRQLEARARELEAVSPQSVLRRGYTMTIRKKDGAVLRSAEQVKPGDKLVTRFSDGQVESTANDSR